MFVKITKCERETLWYADAVGVEIEVKPRDDGFFEVIDENTEEPWIGHLIKDEDCELIEEI